MLILDTEPKRLRAFIELRFKSISDFTRILGVNRQFIRNYIKETDYLVIDNFGLLNKLEELGLNTSWYRTGDGEMLNENEWKNEDLFDNLNSNVRQITGVELEKAKQGYNTYIRFKQASIPLNSGLSDSYNIYTDRTRMISLSEDALGFAASGDENMSREIVARLVGHTLDVQDKYYLKGTIKKNELLNYFEAKEQAEINQKNS